MAKKNFGEKASFIRSMPSDMKPKDVVAAAKEKGITITPTHVYKVRAAGGKKKPGRKPGRPKGSGGGGRGAKGTGKAAFVRSLPASMSGKDVVTEAAKKGIKISLAHVYNIRSETKRAAKKKGGRPAAAPAAAAGAPRRGRPPGRPKASASAGTGSEQQLLKAIAEIGLNRARELFASVERALGGLA